MSIVRVDPLKVTAEIPEGLAPWVQAGQPVELQVFAWLKELFGFPAGAGGALVSGCSVANLTALAVARNARAGFDVRAKGLAAASERLTVYGSVETHASSLRALEVLGLGREAFQAIPVDDLFKVRVDLLRERIHADRRAGARPLCVLGSAGSVNTGAFDDLNALADLCAQENLWLHVDGAFGALAILSPARRAMLRGIERADSLAFDLHKWLHVPYDAGAVLLRSEQGLAGAAGCVLQIDAHRTRARHAADGLRHVLGRPRAVPALDVGGDRQAHGLHDSAYRAEHLGAVHTPVVRK